MLYLIVGTIPSLQERALTQLRAKLPECDPEVFEGSQVTGASLGSACLNISLLAPTSLVIVRQADKIPKKVQSGVLEMIAALPEATTLVLVAPKIDKRLKWWQTLLKQGKLLSAEAPTGRDCSQALQQELKQRGLSCSRDAFTPLLEFGQADWAALLMYLERVELYLGDATQITLEVLTSCGGGGLSSQIFAWAENVASRNWRQAFTQLQVLWRNQEQPLAMLSLLIRHFRILLLAVENKSLWGRSQELARCLGVPPFVTEKYVKQARRFQSDGLKSLWADFRQLEYDLKSSPLTKESLFEAFLWKLKARPGLSG